MIINNYLIAILFDGWYNFCIMKSFSKNKSLNIRHLLIAAVLMTAVITMTFIFGVPVSVASADYSAEVIFPSNGYIQTSSPNMISANGNYLLVFDDALSKLFVRSSNETEDYTYDFTGMNVSQILAVGDIAFITADETYFTLDLTDRGAVPQECSLPSPVPSKKSSLTITSDGTYIYAKSVAGCVSVYNENIETSFEADNHYEDILTGKCVFTGVGDTVYTFTSINGVPYFNSYKFGEDEYQEFETDYYVQEAYAGDVIFAKADDMVILINPSDGTCIKETEISPDSFCADGSNLYTVEGSVISVYTYDSASSDIALTSSISMSGSDNRHLNTPKDIIKTSDMSVIADSGNNRIGLINASGEMETVMLSASPSMLASSGDAIFALCDDNNIYKISDGAAVQSYLLEGASDITYLDKLYAVKNDGIYTLIGGRFVKFLTTANAKMITSSKDGNSLYILTDNDIKVVSKDAYLYKTLLTGSFDDVKDFEIDFAGNIYLLKESGITKYINNLYSLEEDETFSASTYLTVTPEYFCLDGDYVYLSCSECIIIKDLYKSETKGSYLADELVPGDETSEYFEKTNPDAFMTDATGNSDTVNKVPDYAIEIYENVKKTDNLVLAKTKDGFFIVNINDFSKTESSQNINIYKTTKDAEGYEDLLSSPVSIPVGTELTSLYQQTVNGTTYIKASYNGTEYFVDMTSLEIVKEIVIEEPEEPAEPEKQFARIKSSRIGAKVDIYSAPSEDSPVILQLVDGKKVQILSEENGYCRISYEGNEGYILKSSLQFKGLTTIQTVAIILSVIVFLAGSVIAISFYWQKKKNH